MEEMLVADILEYYDGYVIVKTEEGQKLADTIEDEGDIHFGVFEYKIVRIEATAHNVLTLIVK